MDEEFQPVEISTPRSKRIYEAPRLVRLGNLRDVTQKTGYRGANDRGFFPFAYKTSY
ncbi:lasso RiPP family leader peptide-containing protein [uncultured Reyranella sp.]|jgi:hypothetical protein|uniref:lasso RiPP family leader peptide-containing protein n=1 Tax=uncultured Reyranella sp. TaxID=735512 RepID=UPI003390412F